MSADLAAMRPRLFGIAYRILGSIGDAEDVVQTAFLRLEEHRHDDIRDAGGWLATVTARLAIDRARAAARERERYTGEWLPEPLVDADPADETTLADDIAIGFLRVLERLGPLERTAMLLHDVFDYSHAEIAHMLGKNEDAVRQMASRARSRVRAERPRVNVDRERANALVDRFIRALHEGDIEELRAVLASDVVNVADGGGRVAAALKPVEGRENVARLLQGLAKKYWHAGTLRRIDVNAQPGVGIYEGEHLRVAVAFDFSGEGIRGIYAVVNPEKLTHQGYAKGAPAL